MNKTLLLGTAQWGWTRSKMEAFALLDAWLKAGFRQVDMATNYPINQNPADFRAAENILREYIQAHGLHDLAVTMKIGSLDNIRSPEVNLHPSFIQMMSEEYRRLFDSNLACVMFHWDNRSERAEIQASLAALDGVCRQMGVRPGLSGLAHPSVYAQILAEMKYVFDIQLKHNPLHSDFPRYKPFLSPDYTGPKPAFYAYGLNVGGVKLDQDFKEDSTFLARGGQVIALLPMLEKLTNMLPKWNASVRPPVKTMNQLGLIYAHFHPDLSGIVLGASTPVQVQETLDFWRNFEVFDYQDVFAGIQKISAS